MVSIFPTVSNRAIRAVLDYASSRGADPTAILPTAIAPLPDACEEDARVPVTRLRGFWDRAARSVDDPAFGLHAALATDDSTFGAFSFLIVTSSTWREAMNRVCRYLKLMDSGSRYMLEVDGSRARYEVRSLAPRKDRRHLIEFSVMICFAFSQRHVALPWAPIEVCFRHDAPQDTTPYTQAFGMRASWNAGYSGFSFDASVLASPLKRADVELSATLERFAQQLEEAVPETGDLAQLVSAEVEQRLPGGDVSLKALAGALGMTPRTMQRRLKNLGASHQAIVDAVRRQQAESMLLDASLSLEEIGFLLGFASGPAFNRAFKRWAGRTPGAFRRELFATR